MSQYVFGAGTMFVKRTDVTPNVPLFLGVTQEWSLSIDQTLVELYGQLKLPVDIAPGELKMTGKVKFARVQAAIYNNSIFAVNLTAASGFDMTAPETNTNLAATTFTIGQGTLFLEDLGVFYHSSGIALAPVTAGPTVGQYIAGVSGTGRYTFNSSDLSVSGGLDFYYTFSTTTQNQLVATNQSMGTGPLLELVASVPYTVGGVAKKFNLKLNEIRASKLPLDFKNKEYLFPTMEFTAFADASGTIGTWSMTE